jgi:hypothetical protein
MVLNVLTTLGPRRLQGPPKWKPRALANELPDMNSGCRVPAMCKEGMCQSGNVAITRAIVCPGSPQRIRLAACVSGDIGQFSLA